MFSSLSTIRLKNKKTQLQSLRKYREWRVGIWIKITTLVSFPLWSIKNLQRDLLAACWMRPTSCMLDETYWLHVGWDILYIHEAKILVKKNQFPRSVRSLRKILKTKNYVLCLCWEKRSTWKLAPQLTRYKIPRDSFVFPRELRHFSSYLESWNIFVFSTH